MKWSITHIYLVKRKESEVIIVQEKGMVNKRFISQNAVVIVLIGLCFLLTSTGYLAWAYHIMALTETPVSEAVTLVAGYLFQAAGIGLYSLLVKRRADLIRVSMYVVPVMHMLCLVPAVLGASLVQSLVFGFGQNLLCGWIAGYYLYRLTCGSKMTDSAKNFGIGYAVAIVLTWVLSLAGRKISGLWQSTGMLVVCLILTAILIIAVRMTPHCEEAVPEEKKPETYLQLPKGRSLKKLLLAAGCLVMLFSIVNSCGFGFPSEDLASGIDLELSRLFYAAGLLAAGYINDKNRRYGAACALAALAVPFLIIAIKGEPVSLMIFWALSYFTFGFYTVYRVILFSDIARQTKLLYLAGAGLMIGRAGDAVGETLCLSLSAVFPVLAGITALLFIISALLLLRIYPVIYIPEKTRQRSEREIFDRYSARHDLSGREREILRFLLNEKTNQEIAEELSISEGTVKYHVHNLLQKTSCHNRVELLHAFAAEHDT